LGDMLELGPYEKQGHEVVGARAAEVADRLVTVGERGHLIAAAARRTGLRSDRISEFDDADAAIAYLRESLTDQDVVLVKGSRKVRMERVASALEERG
jgi:UDP-N-acetylmuramoyl-tripeptide--D-alanyl-D-alanine ligase